MKIKMQFILSLVLFSVVLLIVAGSFFFADGEQHRLEKQNEIATNIESGATELSYLTGSYLLNHTFSQRVAWESKFTELSQEVKIIDGSDPEVKTLAASIQTTANYLYVAFENTANKLETNPPTDPAALQTFIANSWDLLQTPEQDIISNASNLAVFFETSRDTIQQREIFFTVVILILIIGYFIVNYFLVYRHTLRSMAEIQAGARFIGAGNLDYVMPAKYDDEIGDLSRSFNKMTASLKTITASKLDLEKEIFKRAEAEEELNLTNEELRIANENLQENAQKLELEITGRAASEERFRGVFQKAPYAVALLSMLDGRYADLNEAFLKMTGFSRGEVIGKNNVELGLFPDAASRAKFAALLKERNSIHDSETTIRTRSGELRIVSAFIEPVTLGGEGYWLAMQVDITERKKAVEGLARANQKVSEILASITDDFYVLDRDWNFTYANRKFTSKINKEPSNFIGQNFWQMFPNHVGTALEENFRVAMGLRETRRFEIKDKYIDAWYRMTAFPSAEGITVLGEDITDIKKAEESLRESYSELERIGRAAVDRELRMIELKKEINRYYNATGQPPRYVLDPDEDK